MKPNYNRRGDPGWVITLDKLLSIEEIEKLQKWAKEQKTINPNDKKAHRDWFAVECLTNTGLRVAELADLRCGDIVLRDELSCVHVRNGKCHKERDVMINRSFQKEAMEYIKWKEVVGENIGPDDVLLYSAKSNGKFSTRAIEGWFKQWIKEIGISLKHSIHHLRHTYATMLYKSSNHNLILVQNQLGHSSPEITQVYARVYKEEIADAVEKLF